MSEISNIRPWEHIHATTGKTEYFIDVHLAGVIEPDEWQFGTNYDMWLGVIAVMRQALPASDPSRRVVYVDVGDMAPEEAKRRLEAYPAV